MRRVITSVAVLGLLVMGCMTYDFQPVLPLAIAQTRTGGVIRAKKLKPNLMLLVDNSGSMNDYTSGGSGPTKIQDLRTAMGQFLGQSPAVARMGLAVFPSDSTCGASTAIAQGLPPPSATDDAAADAANASSAQAILGKINALSPTGGTPTGGSLEFLGNYSGFGDDPKRSNFIVLLTDGLPNCNPTNPNSCANPTACNCTLASCGSAGSTFCTLGCLDQVGVVDKITALKAKNINVIVIGFGADTAGAASTTLNAMAMAGGFPRSCPAKTDAECGTNNACDKTTGLCTTTYYQSSSGTALAQDLVNIGNLIGKNNPCIYPLDTTATLDPKFISVDINGQPVNQGPDTWTLDTSTNTIVFAKNGSTCTQILASTEDHPVVIDVRALEQL